MNLLMPDPVLETTVRHVLKPSRAPIAQLSTFGNHFAIHAADQVANQSANEDSSGVNGNRSLVPGVLKSLPTYCARVVRIWWISRRIILDGQVKLLALPQACSEAKKVWKGWRPCKQVEVPFNTTSNSG